MLSAILLYNFTTSVFAHPSFNGVSYDSSTTIGNENLGWIVKLNKHSELPPSTLTLRYTFGMEPAQIAKLEATNIFNGSIELFEEMVEISADKWSEVVSFQKVSSNTRTLDIVGHVTASDFDDVSYITNKTASAVTYSGSPLLNGHYSSWEIIVNIKNFSEQNRPRMYTLVHEFGHVIGLADLYESQNEDKVMYGYSFSNHEYNPTSEEIMAGKLILGFHTTHNWSDYKYYDTYLGNNRHSRHCTDCTGMAVNSNNEPILELCQYNQADICVRCGIRKGTSINSVEESE